MNVAEGDRVCTLARMVARKAKAPKHSVDVNQTALELPEVETTDPDMIEIGGEEQIDDSLLDE